MFTEKEKILGYSVKNEEELLPLVVEEAKMLRKYATRTELDKLNINMLDAQSTEHCVYGLMTGSCMSERAYNLIRKCCNKVYENNRDYRHISIFLNKLNGKPWKISSSKVRLSYYTSPIENFLVQYRHINYWDSLTDKWVSEEPHEYVLKLIKFLKGEIDELKF